MLRVLFLTEGTTVPSTRFRVGQFIPHFERKGISCVVRAGYGDQYNRISRTKLGAPYKLLSRLKRVALGADISRFDVVFLQRPAIPFTSLPERLMHQLNTRTVFDFDDNLTIGSDGQTNPRRKASLELAARKSAHVIAGNQFLANLIPPRDHLTIIPTVIDTDLYTPAKSPFASPDQVMIGWMGTAGNFTYLRDVLPALLEILARHDNVRVRLVSNARLPELEDHAQVEQIGWTADTEIDLLRSFDIGLMPLRDSLGAKGKCGFKMIQYMAVGTSVVSSPVGANCDIFKDSDAGFLASDNASWVDALETLVQDQSMRKRMGQNARVHAVKGYSIYGVLDKYIEIFDRVASTT